MEKFGAEAAESSTMRLWLVYKLSKRLVKAASRKTLRRIFQLNFQRNFFHLVLAKVF